jgi:hypothetical protein
MTKLQTRNYRAKARRKVCSYFSGLGVLCPSTLLRVVSLSNHVFARVIFFPFGNSKTTPISNMLN